MTRDYQEWKSGLARSPTRLTEAQLKRVGVTMINPINYSMRCDWCGAVWSPALLPGGGIPQDYWKCPQILSWKSSGQ